MKKKCSQVTDEKIYNISKKNVLIIYTLKINENKIMVFATVWTSCIVGLACITHFKKLRVDSGLFYHLKRPGEVIAKGFEIGRLF